MRQIADHFEAQSIREALVRMVDAQTILDLEAADADELPDMGDVTMNGKAPVYGNKAKTRQHRTPDSLANDKRYQQTHIIFDDDDKAQADMEAGYKPNDWEGEFHDR
jgi:hypothetical protein